MAIATQTGVLPTGGIMIHDACPSSAARALAALALAAGLTTTLGACASATDYPSFAIPSPQPDKPGRVAMRFPGVAVPEPREPDALPEALPEALPSELDAALAANNARAVAANRAFSDTLESAQGLAALAARSPVESDSWAEAQLRLADLVSHHSAADLALADLDEIAARAELAGAAQELAEIARLRAELAPALEGQARWLDTINAQLAR